MRISAFLLSNPVTDGSSLFVTYFLVRFLKTNSPHHHNDKEFSGHTWPTSQDSVEDENHRIN